MRMNSIVSYEEQESAVHYQCVRHFLVLAIQLQFPHQMRPILYSIHESLPLIRDTQSTTQGEDRIVIL